MATQAAALLDMGFAMPTAAAVGMLVDATARAADRRGPSC